MSPIELFWTAKNEDQYASEYKNIKSDGDHDVGNYFKVLIQIGWTGRVFPDALVKKLIESSATVKLLKTVEKVNRIAGCHLISPSSCLVAR